MHQLNEKKLKRDFETKTQISSLVQTLNEIPNLFSKKNVKLYWKQFYKQKISPFLQISEQVISRLTESFTDEA